MALAQTPLKFIRPSYIGGMFVRCSELCNLLKVLHLSGIGRPKGVPFMEYMSLNIQALFLGIHVPCNDRTDMKCLGNISHISVICGLI